MSCRQISFQNETALLIQNTSRAVSVSYTHLTYLGITAPLLPFETHKSPDRSHWMQGVPHGCPCRRACRPPVSYTHLMKLYPSYAGMFGLSRLFPTFYFGQAPPVLMAAPTLLSRGLSSDPAGDVCSSVCGPFDLPPVSYTHLKRCLIW